MAQVIADVLVGVAVLSVKYPIGGSYVDVGFTEDGVIGEFTAETADILVEEKTFPISRKLTVEGATFTCNMAQASLDNINKAIPGGVLAGSVLSIGGGTIKEMSAKLVGTNPAGFDRTIEMALCTATGGPAIGFRKGEKSQVAIILSALDNGSDTPVVVTDSTS